MIHPCDCVSAYQDERYGPHQRVFNPRYEANSARLKGHRCTVCRLTIDAGGAPAKAKKGA